MPSSKRRTTFGALALGSGGLAPMVTGAIGMRDLLEQGYFAAKSGGIVSGATGWIACGLLIRAGLGVMVLSLRQYRRHTLAEP